MNTIPDKQQKKITVRTPFRMTLAGGGTDVLWYSSIKGGAWISGALSLYVTVSVKQMSNGKNKNISPIVKACIDMANLQECMEVSFTSDVEAGSGLGGSGAFEVGLLHALYEFQGRHTSKLQLAHDAASIEIDVLKRPVGPQDQYICALGGIHSFEIDTYGNVLCTLLKLSNDSINTLENNLLYFQTPIVRDASVTLGDQKKRLNTHKDDKNKIIQALDDIKDLGLQIKKDLLKGKINNVGASFHDHWMIKKTLSASVSNPEIDTWYSEAIKAGALGGKIMGAGGGGWFVFYVNKNHSHFSKRMSQLGLVKHNIMFDWQGTRKI